jgi:hypothetical protein
VCGANHKKIDSAATKRHGVSNSRGSGGNEKIASITWKINHEVGGPWLFQYYMFVHNYGRDPKDFTDFLDGIAALGVILEIQGPRF